MPELSEEERERIFEEERVRAEARRHFQENPPNSDRTTPATSCCVILVVLAILFGLVRGCSPAAPSSPSSSSEAPSDLLSDSDAIDRAKSMAEVFVKGRLKAPSTADFSPWNEDHADKLIDAPPTFRVTGWVDSQNSFGAKLRSQWSVKLHYVGNSNWVADSVDVQTSN